MTERLKTGVRERLQEIQPKPYSNGGAFGKGDIGAALLLSGVLVLVIFVAWLVHDVFGVDLPSAETLDFVKTFFAILGIPLGVLYARRFKP